MKLLNRQHIKEYYKENVAMAKRDSMKKQIKSFIVAAQGQALWTNYRMERIAKTNGIQKSAALLVVVLLISVLP